MLIHSFPYKRVKQESDIVIYGCGVAGKEYIAQVKATEWCHIHYIIDNGVKTVKYKDLPVLSHESFRKLENRNSYTIVIAMADQNAAAAVIKELKQDGMPDGQIIWEDTLIMMPAECTKNAVMSDISPIKNVDEGMADIEKQMIKSNLMVSELPRSITNCGRKEEFENLFLKFTNADKYNYLDMTRLVNFMLNITRTIENVDGSAAELGVYRGDTASILASICQRRNKKLFLLDTYEGFFEKDLTGVDSGKNKRYVDTSVSYVKDVIGDTENVYFIKGYFPDSAIGLPEEERYCFVHIDCDLYCPIKSGLEYFWPKLNTGGMIMVHDYSSGHWEGATKAVDEFCDIYGILAVMIPDLSGSVLLIKN